MYSHTHTLLLKRMYSHTHKLLLQRMYSHTHTLLLKHMYSHTHTYTHTAPNNPKAKRLISPIRHS